MSSTSYDTFSSTQPVKEDAAVPTSTDSCIYEKKVSNTVTPLPRAKIFAISVVMINESLGVSLLFPFVGYLISTFNLTSSKDTVGYFAGLVVASFQLAQFMAAPLWGQWSDRYGRRPVLLCGLVASGLCYPLFGLSRGLWGAILWRFVSGLCNGNYGSAKAYIAEITDQTNQAAGFATLSFTWGFGCFLGPMIGGQLYGAWSSDPFWSAYPALLPCLVVAGYSWFAFFVAYFIISETNPNAVPLDLSASFSRMKRSRPSEPSPSAPSHEELSWSSLLRPQRMRLIMSIYTLMSLVDSVDIYTFSLWAIASRASGGLNMDPHAVGYVLMWYGMFTLTAPVTFPSVVRAMGTLPLLRWCSAIWIVMLLVLPCISDLPSTMTPGQVNLILVFWMLIRSMISMWGFSICFMLITNECKSYQLAFAHGVGEALGCLSRAGGPAVGSTILAWSLGGVHGYPFNHHFVFVCTAICLGVQTKWSTELKTESIEQEREELRNLIPESLHNTADRL